MVDMNRFNCVGCGVNTSENGEYYMVTNNIWRLFGAGNGMLCIGCLEKNMGRKLDHYDFLNVPVNYLGHRSHRLRNRLGN
jgi:hypothetical protein